MIRISTKAVRLGAMFSVLAAISSGEISGSLGRTVVGLSSASEPLMFRVLGDSQSKWMIGVRVLPGSKPELIATAMRFVDKPAGVTIEGGEAASAEEVAVAGRLITLVPNKGRKLVVYVVVPQPTRVTVDGLERAEMTVNRDTIFASTGIVTNPLMGWHTVASFAVLEEMARGVSASATPQPTRTDGAQIVSWKRLAEKLVQPPALPALGVAGKAHVKLVEITVNAQGDVESVVVVGVPENPAWSKVAGAVKSWKFHPMEVGGRATEVVARVPIMVLPDGQLRSPTFSQCPTCAPGMKLAGRE